MSESLAGASEQQAPPAVSLDTLRATIDRIIPADDFPSASDAGVLDYILGQLAGDAHDLTPSIAAGLAALDQEARQRHALPFTALAPEQQDRLFSRIEAGDVSVAWPTSPITFFASLVELTVEGYYSDPGNGGNRDALSWKMIGYHPRVPGVECQ